MDRGKIKFYIKEYLTFSKGEKIGIITLISIILVIIVVFYLLPYLIPPSPKIDISEFEKEITNFEKVSDSSKVSLEHSYLKKDTFHNKKKLESSSQPKLVVIELNTADSASLDQLPGIGPVFARRILKYRTILGGYYSLNQLNEVYGIKPEIVTKIERYLRIDTSKIRKIDLNTAEFKEINAHPYISYEQTKSIMKLRVHNKFKSLNQLEGFQIFSHGELIKLKPYLSLEP